MHATTMDGAAATHVKPQSRFLWMGTTASP